VQALDFKGAKVTIDHRPSKRPACSYPTESNTVPNAEQPLVRPWEDERYVGFADLLGYKALTTGPKYSPEQRFNLLHSAYVSLAIALNEVMEDPTLTPDVRLVQMSDSIFFTSRSAVKIVTAMATLFSTVFGVPAPLYDHEEPSEWWPFLRGAIVRDWIFEARDYTVPNNDQPRDAFRIPIGPAVARAYLLSESEDTRIEGMRLVCTNVVNNDFRRECDGLDGQTEFARRARHLAPIYLKSEPTCGPIHEVPWLELQLQDGLARSMFQSLDLIESQFDGAMKHYRGTWDMILRMPTIRQSEELLAIAETRRTSVVQKMAGQNWLKRGGKLWDDWTDWFAAEGK